MNITTDSEHDEARDILEAVRQIQDMPGLRAEAETNPESVLDRLHLSGVARHAVAFALTGLLVAPGAIGHLSGPNNFWH